MWVANKYSSFVKCSLSKHVCTINKSHAQYNFHLNIKIINVLFIQYLILSITNIVVTQECYFGFFFLSITILLQRLSTKIVTAFGVLHWKKIIIVQKLDTFIKSRQIILKVRLAYKFKFKKKQQINFRTSPIKISTSTETVLCHYLVYLISSLFFLYRVKESDVKNGARLTCWTAND